jgi:TonB family protein
MMTSIYCRVAALFLCLVPVAANAGISDGDLEKEYGNNVLTLRLFYPGPHVHFDATGKADSTGRVGAWTLCGQLHVHKITLKDNVIHIQGQRLFLFYDPETHQLRDVGTITKKDPESKHFAKKIAEWAARTGKTEIEVESGSTQPEMADVTKAMNAVFLAPDEPLTNVVPIIWKRWLEAKDGAAPAVGNPGPGLEAVTKVGGAVSLPHVKYDPDPQYSEFARQAKYQGTVILWLVVDRDGQPTHIRVQRPAGMGLDEEAFDAVRTWKFDPATKDGQPVPVMINVEVNFRLY